MKLVEQARSFTQEVDLENLGRLEATSSDESRAEYKILKSQLIASRNMFPNIRFLYLMAQKPDEKIYFYLDSEPSGSVDESPPGMFFSDAPAAIYEVFSTSEQRVVGPVTDQWGTWISAFIPVVEQETGRIVAVFGLDIDARTWERQLWDDLAVLVIYTGLVVVFAWIILGVMVLRIRSLEFRKKEFWSRYGYGVLAGLIGLCMTLVLTWHGQYYESNSRQDTFERIAYTRAGVIKTSLQNIEDYNLTGLKNFYESSDFVNLREFLDYTQSLRYNDIVSAWSWIPMVQPADIPGLEAAARELGLPNYRVFERDAQENLIPLGQRDVYFPVLYIEPFNPQNKALGYDIGSEETRRSALWEAMETGYAIATDPIELINGPDDQKSFLVFKPVHADQFGVSQVGVVSASIRPTELIRTFQDVGFFKDVSLYLDFVQFFPDREALLLASTASQEMINYHLDNQYISHGEVELTYIQPLFQFGKTYAVVAHPSPEFYQLYPSRLPAIIALAGSLLSFFVGALVVSYTNRDLYLSDLVAQRTRDLEDNEQKFHFALRNSPVAVFQQDLDLRYRWIHDPDPDFDPSSAIGKRDDEIFSAEESLPMLAMNQGVIDSGKGDRQVLQYLLNGRLHYFDTTVDPYLDEDGKIVGIISSSVDITERIEHENQIRRSLERLVKIHEITQYNAKDSQDLLDFTLASAISLTSSKIGYIYLYDEAEQQFILNSWSKDAIGESEVQNPQSIYELEKTGLWGEAVRQRKAIIDNQFEIPNFTKKDYPEGYVHLQRFVTIPVLINQEIVAVLGVANKDSDYTEADVIELTLLMDSVWKILERKKAEDALQESTLQFKKLVENAPEGIFVQVEKRFAYLNPTALRLFGALSEADLLGTPILDRFHPEYHDIVQQRLSLLNDASLPVPEIEEICLRMDGANFDVEVSAVPIQWNEQKGALVFFHDITQRKQLEHTQRLQSTALISAANAIFITDEQGKIEWCNPAWSELSGYSFDETVGENPRFVKSGEHGSAFYDNLWRTIGTGKVWRSEIINRRKDGSLYYGDVTITPVKDDHGKITQFVAVVQDVTERKRNEKKLISQAYEIKRKNAQLEKLYRISHALLMGTTFLDLHQLGRLMIELITQELWAETGYLYLYHSEDNTLSLLASMTKDHAFEVSENICLDQDPLSLEIIASKETRCIPDLASISPEPCWLKNGRTALASPLIHNDETIALLVVLSPEVDRFQLEDVQLFSLYTAECALVLKNASLMAQNRNQISHLESLRVIDENISASLDLDMTAETVLEQMRKQLAVDAVNFLVYNPKNQSLESIKSLGFQENSQNFKDVLLGEGLTGKAAESMNLFHVSNLGEKNDEYHLDLHLVNENFVEYYGLPLVLKGNLKGMLEIYNRKPVAVDESWLDYLMTLSGQVAIAIDNIKMVAELANSIDELKKAYDENVLGWGQALDMRDKETEGHTLRVEAITFQLAQQLGIQGDDLIYLRWGSLLHDIGKMGIPDHILLKSGPLTDEEWQIMRTHPEKAYELLNPITFLRPAMEIPYHHHECWDGTGYPQGLKGEEIPLSARIFAVVDVWDALISDRPYRPAWSEEKALDYIQAQSGRHFDPDVVEVFLRFIGKSFFMGEGNPNK